MPPPFPPPSNRLHGTWERAFPDLRTVAKLTEKRLTVEIAFTMANDKKASKGNVIRVGADGTCGPDGGVFGVVTDVDFEPGDPAMRDKVKAAVPFDLTSLIGEPFAAKVRLEDGALVLREVRCSALPGAGGKSPLNSLILGRYQPLTEKATPPRPALKKSSCPDCDHPPEARVAANTSSSPWLALRDEVASFFGNLKFMQTTTSGMTLPSPHYLQHPPQYYPPGATFPLARELESSKTIPPAVDLPPVPGPGEFLQLLGKPGAVGDEVKPAGAVVPAQLAPDRIPMAKD